MSSTHTPPELTNPIRGLAEWVQTNAAPYWPQPPLVHSGRFIETYDPVLGLGFAERRAADHIAVLLSLDECDLLRGYQLDHTSEDDMLRDKLVALAHEPNARHVRHLMLCDWSDDPYDLTLWDCQIVLALCSLAQRFPNLKSLYVGDSIARGRTPTSYVGDVRAALRHFPRLEELHVRSRSAFLGRLQHTHLKSLRIEILEEAYDVMLDLTHSHLPALTRLDLWLTDMGGASGFDEFDDDIDQDELDLFAPLFSGKATPSLRHLAMCNTWLSDPLTIELAASPLFGRLHHLDLSGGTLTDRGANALLAAADHTRLASLDISRNFISAATRARLRSAGSWTLIDHGQRLDEWFSPEHPETE